MSKMVKAALIGVAAAMAASALPDIRLHIEIRAM